MFGVIGGSSCQAMKLDSEHTRPWLWSFLLKEIQLHNRRSALWWFEVQSMIWMSNISAAQAFQREPSRYGLVANLSPVRSRWCFRVYLSGILLNLLDSIKQVPWKVNRVRSRWGYWLKPSESGTLVKDFLILSICPQLEARTLFKAKRHSEKDYGVQQ